MYCKNVYLRIGKIYTSYVVSVKLHKIPPPPLSSAFGKKNKSQNFSVVNHASVYVIPTHII